MFFSNKLNFIFEVFWESLFYIIRELIGGDELIAEVMTANIQIQSADKSSFSFNGNQAIKK